MHCKREQKIARGEYKEREKKTVIFRKEFPERK